MNFKDPKVLLGLGVLFVAVLIGICCIGWKGGVLGSKPELVVYSGTGKAILYVPFDADTRDALFVDAYIDRDNNGAISDDEKVISHMRTNPDRGWRNGYAIAIDRESRESTLVKIVLSNGEVFEGTAAVTSYDPDKLLDLESSTNPNSMKQGGVVPETAPLRSDTPDITQRLAECAPTSAANSVISLAGQHGKKLSNPTDVVNGLKAEMDWTLENGVSPEKFVEGKDKYMAKLGLPIRTTLVGGDDGRGTIQEIKDALAEGKAAEVQLKFHNPETGEGKGSHMLTVVGVEEVDGKTLIKVHDPNTPAGTEMYDVSSGEVTNYPSKWSTTFGWGFVQTWEGSPTGTVLDPMTDAEVQGIQQFVGDKEMVEVLIYKGAQIPVAQLHVGKPHPKHEYGEGCNQTHWHADGEVESLAGHKYRDPNPGGCGFGRTSELEVKSVAKPK